MNYSYPILKREIANHLFQLICKGEKPDTITEEQFVGSGKCIIEDVDLDNLYKSLEGLLRKSKGPNKSALFEAEGSALLHSALAFLPPYLVTDPEFWMWLTFIPCNGKFAAIVVQRFGKDAKPDNFSLGPLPESLFFRLWWRGFKGRADGYDIAKRGDIDLWRSHIIRIESPMSDVMTQAFVKTIMPEPNQVKVPIKQSLIRSLAIKLTARHASCAYETLSETECLSLIEALFNEVKLEAGE